jgi:hypothetical protein
LVVRDLEVTGWHSDLSKGESALGGGPQGIKGGPAGVAQDRRDRGVGAPRGRNVIGTRGPNRVNEWPGALMGPRIPNLEADLGHSGGVDFQQAQSRDVKAEGLTPTITDFRSPAARDAVARSPSPAHASSPLRTGSGSSC